MIHRFQEWLAAPRFADPEVDRVSRTAYTCAAAFIAVVALWVPTAYFLQDRSLAVLAIGLAGISALLVVAILARKGHARSAAFTLVGMFFAVASAGIFLEGGLERTNTGTFLAAVLAASLFFSAREAFVAAGLAALLLLLFWGLDQRGMLPEVEELAPERYVIGNLTLIAVIVVLVRLSVGRMREAQGFLQQVADATPHAVYVYNIEEGRVSYGNASTATQLGYGHLPAEGREGLQRVIHPDDMHKVAAQVRAALQARDDEVLELEFRAQAADGSWRWIRDQIRVFDRQPNGRTRQLLGVAEDVTDVKEAQHALERSRARLQRGERLEALGQLAGGIAHDFNNHLTVILGSAEAAKQRITHDSELATLIEEIHHAAQRSAELTRQLLTFSRHQLLQPEILDLMVVLQTADRLLRRVMPDNIDVRTICKEAPCRIKADPSQIEQLIMNLALNSRDAMPDGGSITIECAIVVLGPGDLARIPDATPGRNVVLSVSDTGEGMDEDTQKHIFEPLFTTKDPGRGTGFGLATVEAIVRQCGGSIEVDTAPGAGTAFKVYFPWSSEEPTEEAPLAPEAIAGPKGGESVLLVEDNEMVRRLARRSLESLGYGVTDAANGFDALQLFRSDHQQFGAVLTDVMMPGLSGLELAQRMRETRPDMPIVFMSGYIENGLVGHDFDPKEIVLNKPFTIEQLESSIANAIKRD